MRKFTCLVLAASIGLTMLSFSACAGAEKKATSLSLSSAELCVNAGEDAKLTATVDEAAAQKGVNWSSANEQIATVSEDGTIKGVSFGRTMITAKTVDGSALTESCEVTVTNDSGAMDTADVIVKQDLSDYPELEGQAASSATLTFHADKSCEIDAFYGGLAIAAVKYKTTYSVEDGVLTFAEQGVPVNVLFFSSEAYTVAQVRGDKIVIEITVGDTLCATFIMDEAAALSHGIYVGKDIPVTGIEAEEEIVISANSTVDVSDLVRVLPENATEKGITVEMVQNNAPDILSLSGTQITAKALEGDCRLRATTVEGNFSVEFTVKAVIRPDDFPEDYYKDSGAKGTLEKKYSPYGAHEVKVIENKQAGMTEVGAYKIWYPADLTQKTPAVVYLNGSNCTYSTIEPVFKHLASWGFIVIGNNQTQAISGVSALESVQILKQLNADAESPLYQKVDEQKIGLFGGSQGAAGSINAALSDSEYNVFASVAAVSAPTSGILGTYDLTGMEKPFFFLAGTGVTDSTIISPLTTLQDSFNKCVGFTVMARRKDADHEDMTTMADGYLTAWFLYTLKGDPEAAGVFVGAEAELTKNTENWQDVQIKGTLAS